MARRIVFNLPEVGEFVAERAECLWHPANDHCIGVVDDEKLGTPGFVRGGAIYTNYTGASISVHIAGVDENWMTRDFIAIGFDYPFNQLGVGLLLGIVSSGNQHTLDFDLKLGYREIARIPGMFADGDGIVLGMRPEECRWLRLKPKGYRSNI